VDAIYLATRDLYPTNPSSSAILLVIVTGLLRRFTAHKTQVKIFHLWAEPSCPYKPVLWINAQTPSTIMRSFHKIAWWSATTVKMRSLGSTVPPTRYAISACQATLASYLVLKLKMFFQQLTPRTQPRVLRKRFQGVWRVVSKSVSRLFKARSSVRCPIAALSKMTSSRAGETILSTRLQWTICIGISVSSF